MNNSLPFSSKSKLSSANSFSLGGSKIYCFGKGYLFTTQHDIDFTALYATAGESLKLTQVMEFVLYMYKVENIVGNGENAGYQHFLHYSQVFSRPLKLAVV